LPRIGNLPRYAQEWVTGQLNSKGEVKKTKPSFIEQNAKIGEEYTLPLFRLTIKVHKTPPEGRPVTANQNWITQPLVELVAHLLQPINRELDAFGAGADGEPCCS
jgi:hypothetical protein